MTEDFLAKAKTYLGEEGRRVRNYFCCGLQDFSPEPGSYDVIWIQWVIGEAPGCAHSAHPAGSAILGPWDSARKVRLLQAFGAACCCPLRGPCRKRDPAER